jgi:hypothetical protein
MPFLLVAFVFYLYSSSNQVGAWSASVPVCTTPLDYGAMVANISSYKGYDSSNNSFVVYERSDWFGGSYLIVSAQYDNIASHHAEMEQDNSILWTNYGNGGLTWAVSPSGSLGIIYGSSPYLSAPPASMSSIGTVTCIKATNNVTYKSDFDGGALYFDAALTKPSNLQATSKTPSSFNLSWGASSFGNASPISYEIFKDGTTLGVTSDTSQAITGLSPSTTYNMSVVASNINGDKSIVSLLSVNTPPVVTITTPTPAITVGHNAQVEITGTTSDVASYELFINDVSQTIGSGNFTNYTWDTTGLASDDYTIRLDAVDSFGNSNSDNVTITVDNTPPVVTITTPATPTYMATVISDNNSFEIADTASEATTDVIPDQQAPAITTTAKQDTKLAIVKVFSILGLAWYWWFLILFAAIAALKIFL